MPGVFQLFLLLLLFTPSEFFTSVLADSLSLDFEWQQVSLSLRDSSQYSGRSQPCGSLDGLCCYFLLFPSDYTKRTNYNWYNRQFHVPQFFQFPSKIDVLIPLFTFTRFHSLVAPGHQNQQFYKSSFFFSFLFFFYKIWSSGRDLVIRLYLKIQRSLCVSFSRTDFWVVNLPFVRIVKLQIIAQFHQVVPSLVLFCVNLLHSLIT